MLSDPTHRTYSDRLARRIDDYIERVTIDGRPHWLFSNGKTLPVVAGGADAPATPPAPAPAPPAAPIAAEPTDDPPLGEAGEKALQAWKDRAKAAEAAAKALPTLQAELDQLRAANMTDHDKALAAAVDAAKTETRTEILGSVNSKLFTSELKAATATVLIPAAQTDLLVDTTVALKLLGLDEIPVTPTGDIDGAAIARSVAEYVAARPHLASATQTPGSADLGARTPSPTKTTAEQIAEAEAKGDINGALRLKSQQLVELRSKTP